MHIDRKNGHMFEFSRIQNHPLLLILNYFFPSYRQRIWSGCIYHDRSQYINSSQTHEKARLVSHFSDVYTTPKLFIPSQESRAVIRFKLRLHAVPVTLCNLRLFRLSLIQFSSLGTVIFKANNQIFKSVLKISFVFLCHILSPFINAINLCSSLNYLLFSSRSRHSRRRANTLHLLVLT